MYRWISLVFVMIPLLSGCFSEQPERFEWRLQSQAAEDSIDFQSLKLLADQVQQMSQGRLIIIPYPGGTITDGADIYNAVREKRVEMGNGWPNWWVSQHPAWAVMNAGPFDFMNLDASMMFFLDGEGTDIANELSLPDGVIWRPAWWAGMEFGLLSRTEISGLDDLKGKKVRIGPGVPGATLEKASGAYTIPTVAQEVRPALENGDLDVVEWTTAGGAWSLGLNDVISAAIIPAIWQPSVLSDFLINREAFETLPVDLQAILESAMRSYTLTTTLKAKKADFQAFQEFRKAGISITTWSEADLQRWKQASDQVWQEYADQDETSRRVIEKKRAFKAQYDAYYQWFGPYD